LCHGRCYLDCSTFLVLEDRGVLDIVEDLLLDEPDVGFEGALGETELDKSLLLDELRVGAVVDHIAAKDGCRERAVDLLRVEVRELAVEDKLVSVDAEVRRDLAAEEDKGEDVAILRQLRRLVRRETRILELYIPFLGSL